MNYFKGNAIKPMVKERERTLFIMDAIKTIHICY